MSFLLDTNVLSETAREKPSASVMALLAAEDRLRVSSVTVYELSHGVARLREGKRRRFLEAWLAQLLDGPIDVLPFDAGAALAAADLEERGRAAGKVIEVRDLFILATARSRGLRIATRNVAHFSGFGVGVVDPFSASPARP